jgi:hypothetical protein
MGSFAVQGQIRLFHIWQPVLGYGLPLFLTYGAAAFLV